MYSVVKIVLTKTTKKNINNMNVVFLTNDKNILFLLLMRFIELISTFHI
jgi:hypothetical protein